MGGLRSDPESGRVAVNLCPYCGGEQLRPRPEPRGAWRCAACTRVFVVGFVGLQAGDGRTGSGHTRLQRDSKEDEVAINTPETGATLWLTGLSGAGKSTIAVALADRLGRTGRRVQVLDGDELRTNLSADLGFSKEDRCTQVRRVGFVAELLARHGVVAVVPVIAPYADARAQVRGHHVRHGTAYHEIYVSTSLDECRRRDVKGLYAKADAGLITGMTGIDDPYEPPVTPDLTIDTAVVPLETSVAAIDGLLQVKECA